MFKKIAALGAAAVLGIGLLTGCGASASTADAGYSAQNPLVLTLAHGLSETHTVHIAMTQFAEEVNEKTDGRIQVKIFPNGQLGSENENLEQLQAGVIAMTKVSAPGLPPTTKRSMPSACPTFLMTRRISTMSWTRRRCRTSSSRPARTALSR